MRQCRLEGCFSRAWAADLCLDHYVALHHDVTRASALLIRAASGSTREIARIYKVSVPRVHEIRAHRWWGHIL